MTDEDPKRDPVREYTDKLKQMRQEAFCNGDTLGMEALTWGLSHIERSLACLKSGWHDLPDFGEYLRQAAVEWEKQRAAEPDRIKQRRELLAGMGVVTVQPSPPIPSIPPIPLGGLPPRQRGKRRRDK